KPIYAVTRNRKSFNDIATRMRGRLVTFPYLSGFQAVQIDFRIKSVVSIESKIIKKYGKLDRIDTIEELILKVPDLIGLRAICLHEKIFEDFVVFVLGHPDLQLKINSAKYIISEDNKTRLKNHIANIGKIFDENIDFVPPKRDKDNDYTCLHMHLALITKPKNKKSHFDNGIPYNYQCELQIRTISSHIWSELEHVRYKLYIDSKPKTKSEKEITIEHSLKHLNKLLYVVDDIIFSIGRATEDYYYRSFIPVFEDIYRYEDEDEMRKMTREAKESLDEIYNLLPKGPIYPYSTGSNELLFSTDKLYQEAIKLSESKDEILRDNLLLECAMAYYICGEDLKAYAIYRSVLTRHKNWFIANLRIGFLHINRANYEKAIQHLKIAYDKVVVKPEKIKEYKKEPSKALVTRALLQGYWAYALFLCNDKSKESIGKEKKEKALELGREALHYAYFEKDIELIKWCKNSIAYIIVDLERDVEYMEAINFANDLIDDNEMNLETINLKWLDTYTYVMWKANTDKNIALRGALILKKRIPQTSNLPKSQAIKFKKTADDVLEKINIDLSSTFSPLPLTAL
ncbi:MAG: hypothetical protein EPO24_12175, partial [Bacteroidetes bacterium]